MGFLCPSRAGGFPGPCSVAFLTLLSHPFSEFQISHHGGSFQMDLQCALSALLSFLSLSGAACGPVCVIRQCVSTDRGLGQGRLGGTSPEGQMCPALEKAKEKQNINKEAHGHRQAKNHSC